MMKKNFEIFFKGELLASLQFAFLLQVFSKNIFCQRDVGKMVRQFGHYRHDWVKNESKL